MTNPARPADPYLDVEDDEVVITSARPFVPATQPDASSGPVLVYHYGNYDADNPGRIAAGDIDAIRQAAPNSNHDLGQTARAALTRLVGTPHATIDLTGLSQEEQDKLQGVYRQLQGDSCDPDGLQSILDNSDKLPHQALERILVGQYDPAYLTPNEQQSTTDKAKLDAIRQKLSHRDVAAYQTADQILDAGESGLLFFTYFIDAYVAWTNKNVSLDQIRTDYHREIGMSFQAFTDDANRMQNAANAVTAITQRLQRANNELEPTWQGAAAEAFEAELASYLQAEQAVATLLSDTHNGLTAMVSALEQHVYTKASTAWGLYADTLPIGSQGNAVDGVQALNAMIAVAAYDCHDQLRRWVLSVAGEKIDGRKVESDNAYSNDELSDDSRRLATSVAQQWCNEVLVPQFEGRLDALNKVCSDTTTAIEKLFQQFASDANGVKDPFASLHTASTVTTPQAAVGASGGGGADFSVPDVGGGGGVTVPASASGFSLPADLGGSTLPADTGSAVPAAHDVVSPSIAAISVPAPSGTSTASTLTSGGPTPPAGDPIAGDPVAGDPIAGDPGVDIVPPATAPNADGSVTLAGSPTLSDPSTTIDPTTTTPDAPLVAGLPPAATVTELGGSHGSTGEPASTGAAGDLNNPSELGELGDPGERGASGTLGDLGGGADAASSQLPGPDTQFTSTNAGTSGAASTSSLPANQADVVTPLGNNTPLGGDTSGFAAMGAMPMMGGMGMGRGAGGEQELKRRYDTGERTEIVSDEEQEEWDRLGPTIG